jgi:hypothetical protein
VSGELKNQWLVTVHIDGIGNLGAFDQSTGGAGEAAEKKYREGGAVDQTILIGSKSRSNVTVERIFRSERDGPLLKRIDNARGKEMLVSKQPLDDDGNAVGEPIPYGGKVKTVSHPETDSADESATETKVVIEQSTRNRLG